MKRPILITGGAGFIGSNFIHHWLAHRDQPVVNVDALTYAGSLDNLTEIETDPRYTFVSQDIASREGLAAVFEKHRPIGVINFAAETHVDRSIHDSAPFIQTNIIGTHNLLELSRQYEVERYLQVSTDEVYGDLGDPPADSESPRTYFRETTPITPNCPYAASKASADLLVLSWYETYGLPTMISRCSNNYGPYQFPEKLIPFFLFRAMRNEPLPLYGDGLNIRDWLYVRDHCEAIVRIFEKSAVGEVWNIGGHNEKTNREIVDLILTATKSTSEVVSVPDRQAHDRRYAMDPTKIREQLGWVPQHSFEEALPKTIDWYLNNRAWVEARG